MASPTAQHVAWAALVSREPFWQHGFARSGATEAKADRVNVLLRLQHGAAMWVQAPHPREIDLSVSKFLQSRASCPGTLLLVHLGQARMHARFHARGDEILDLQALPGQVVLVVSITVTLGDASSVPKGGVGLILHGVLDSREDVAPGKFALSQGFVQHSQKKLSRVGRERRDEACDGSTSAGVVSAMLS